MNVSMFQGETHYDMQKKLEASRCHAPAVEAIIRRIWPDMKTITVTEQHIDRFGVDFWVDRSGQYRRIAIDLKVRENRYSGKTRDVGLETLSVVGESGLDPKIGWTLDKDKWTDYVLWYWPPPEAYFYLVSFPLLRCVFQERLAEWRTIYDVKKTGSVRWRSEVMFVPITDLANALHQHCHGNI